MRILLAVNFDVEARLIEGIIRAGHDIVDRVTGAAALASVVDQTRPDLVIAQAGPETLNRMSLAACDAAGARTIGVVIGEMERRHAHDLGLIDRITGEQGWDAVAALLARPAPRPAAAGASGSAADQSAAHAAAPGAAATTAAPLRRRDRRREAGRASAPPAAEATARASRDGIVVSVWGPHGAPGASTIAIALAAAFTEDGARVLLIDADSYGGSIALALGITDDSPGLPAACRLAAAGSLTLDELSRVSSVVTCGRSVLRVLTGTSNPARWPELSADRLRKVFEFARGEFDIVVVDAGFNLESDEELMSDVAAPRRNAATHAALESAKVVVAVGEATPIGIQRYLRARLLLDALLGDDRPVETVMNRVRRSVSGADSASQVRQVLLRFGGIERATLLPDDPRATDRALAEALPVTEAAPRSPLAKQLSAFASRLLAEQR